MERRFAEIDALKAAGILTVILIHGLRPSWDPTISAIEAWLGDVTRFAVPGFLLASGFLYAARVPVPATTTRRRLRRLLVPYAIASLCAQVFRAAYGDTASPRELGVELLLGGSFGPYYYVFVIALLMLATPALARLPARALAGLTAACVAAQGVFQPGCVSLPFFWHLRNPLFWGAYFLIGWQLRLHYGAVVAALVPRRAAAVGVLALLAAGLAAALAGDLSIGLRYALSWLETYVVLALLFAAACGHERPPKWLRELSDVTYPVYLFHLFFVYAARPYFPFGFWRADLASLLGPWLAGLVGSLILVAAARALLGDRSRDVIGA